MQEVNHKDIISETQIHEIQEVEYFRSGMYANLDIPATLDFYYNRYVRQIEDFKKISKETIIVDIGAGYGWLSIAFALNTYANVIAIEPNEPRMNAGKKIARILGVANKIDWRIGMLGNLPLKDRKQT